MSPDAPLLRLACRPHREAIVAALAAKAWTAHVHMALPVIGLPGIEELALFAWPDPPGRPGRVLVDIVRVNDEPLAEPVAVTYELRDDERPPALEDALAVEVRVSDLTARARTVTRRGLTWHLVDEPSIAREVANLRADGTPVWVSVDTAVFCYRLTCVCGRFRYAKPNSIHQITACRACTRIERLRKRALAQYRTRYGTRRLVR